MSPWTSSSSRPGPPLGTPFERWLKRMPFLVKRIMSPRSHSARCARIWWKMSEFTMGVSVKRPSERGARSDRSR